MTRISTYLKIALLLMFSAVSNAGQSQQSVAYIAYTDGFWQAWVMAPDGTRQQQVTKSPYDKSRLSWYPDGKHLLVNGHQGELFRVVIADGLESAIALPMQGMYDAQLSPDGSQIVFSLSPAGTSDGNEIWLVNADGSNPRKQTNMKWLQHDPVWSEDGQSIYFLSGDSSEEHNVWKLSLDKGKREQITVNARYHFDVTVSSTGELAYSSNRSGNYEIWMQTPGKDARQVTHHPALDGKPAWSPGGSELLFESTRGGAPNIWKAGPGGNGPVKLTNYPQGARAPVWFHGRGARS